MKKWGILVLMMSIALHGFAGPFTVKDIPRDVERGFLIIFRVPEKNDDKR